MRAWLGLVIMALMLIGAACAGPAAAPTATPSARPQFIEFFAGT